MTTRRKMRGSLHAAVALLVFSIGMQGCDADVEQVPPVAAARDVRQRPLVIAHRGYSGQAPEHTFAAWQRAADAGADYLEQDLQMTADGVLVVLHDGTLERTARGDARFCTGLVSEHTLAELRNCDFGSWFNAEYPQFANTAFESVRIAFTIAAAADDGA